MAAALEMSAPPAAPLHRPRTLLIGTLFATAGTLAYFAALFGIYYAERSAAESWFPEGAISLVPGTMMFWTLVMSCATIQWAAYAIANGARTQSYLALAVTALLGVAVINQTIFYYLDMGLAIDESRAALLMYVITGSHLAMLGAAIVFVLLMAIRALAGQYAGRQSDGIVAATIYWYAMVAVYFVIWIGIYIAK